MDSVLITILLLPFTPVLILGLAMGVFLMVEKVSRLCHKI